MAGFDNGMNDVGTQLVPASAPSQGRSPWPLYAGVAASVAVTAWYPLVGLLLYGVVLRRVLDLDGRRALGISAAISIVAVAVLAYAIDPGLGLSLAVSIVTGYAVVALMWAHRAGVTAISITIAAVSVASLGADALLLSLQGSDIQSVTVGLLMDSVRMSVGSGIEADMVASAAESVLLALWPFIYPANVAACAAFAGAGSYGASLKSGGRPVQFASFEAPVWSVVVLALGIVAVGAALGGLPGSAFLLPAATTVLMCVRFIFALQGYGVVIFALSRMRLGCLGRMVVIFLVVWLEVMFLVLSIVGLVDVWANFRKLPRGGSDTKTDGR